MLTVHLQVSGIMQPMHLLSLAELCLYLYFTIRTKYLSRICAEKPVKDKKNLSLLENVFFFYTERKGGLKFPSNYTDKLVQEKKIHLTLLVLKIVLS